MADPRAQLLQIFSAALRAVNGRRVVVEYLGRSPVAAPLAMIAIGKAACAMAQGAHDVLGERIHAALVITRRGAAEILPWPVIEAGHPLPDAASLEAGRRLEDFIAQLPAATTVLVLLSGGASALVESLPAGVGLGQLRALNQWLLASGLDISAMNRLRKRVSRIKGGRLAGLLFPRPVLCLAISDVPDNDPRAIGSGPLTADAGLHAPLDATVALPEFVQAMLHSAPPAPAPDDPCFRAVRFEIVATLAMARYAAAAAARELGLRTHDEPALLAGDACAAGQRLARELLAAEPGVVRVWGGETTVILPDHPGRGGRNQALALAAALELQGRRDAWLLAAGTDGSDGPTDDAGALVDGGTLARGERAGRDAHQALRAADSGTFLEASGDLIQTGPTGTNVMDLVLGFRL